MDSTHLQNLLADPSGITSLEKHISTFNVFEATGAVRRELRHSDFIGFLFNPSETHRSEDAFYKIFCGHVGITISNNPVIGVSREWRNIDVLVRDRANKILIVIENKIDTSEHSNQLQRYRFIIESTYPDYDRHYFYLTKTGEEPSDDTWNILSYAEIRVFVETLAESVTGDVATILSHYSKMIERHFMPNNDIAQLCRKIYSEHKTAIDLIIEHRPAGGEDIFEKILELVGQNSALEIDSTASTQSVSFAVKEWDAIEGINTSSGWTKSGRVLLFVVENDRDGNGRVNLRLIVCPAADTIRVRIIEFAKENPDTFHLGKRGEKWTQIYKIELLSRDDMDDDNRLNILEANWNRFFAGDFTRINQLFLSFQDGKRSS